MPYSIFPLVRKAKVVFCVVFHDDSWERIREHDPAILEGKALLTAFSSVPDNVRADLPFALVDIVIAYEPDAKEFAAKAIELGDPEAVLKWLSRNWQTRPEDLVQPVRVGTLNHNAQQED